jgi:hypothetical protein
MGIAKMLAAGQSWNTIQDVTGCRATIAKIAQRALKVASA